MAIQANMHLGYLKATAGELISGNRAVSINSSGLAIVAMANNTSRLPAIGVTDAILSGKVGKVYQQKDFNCSISGNVGGGVYVGSSGTLINGITALLSGATTQQLGVATHSGALIRI